MKLAYVSVGSNVDARSNIARALRILGQTFGPVRRSPVYESAAVGFKGDNFLNLAVCFRCDLSAEALKRALRDIEARLLRDRSGPRFGDRTIDLDLLLYSGADAVNDAGADSGADAVNDAGEGEPPCDAQVHSDEILRYSHVLKPLADLAPQERCDALGGTFAELWRDFSAPKQPLKRVDWSDTPGP